MRALGPVRIPGVRPSALRWHCHTSAVGGQVLPPNPRLPAQLDCYSFYHLPWEWMAESTLGPSGFRTRVLLLFVPARYQSAITPLLYIYIYNMYMSVLFYLYTDIV